MLQVLREEFMNMLTPSGVVYLRQANELLNTLYIRLKHYRDHVSIKFVKLNRHSTRVE